MIAGRISPAGDVDWYALTAQAGHIYQFAAAEGATNLWAYLYGRDTTTLLRSQDYADFTYELSTAGTYYYRVIAYSSSATGAYSVTVTDLGLDDHLRTTPA